MPPMISGLGLGTSHAFDTAYKFTKVLRKRKKSAAFMRSLMLQRLCSSYASGLVTAKKLLAGRSLEHEELELELGDEGLSENSTSDKAAAAAELIGLVDNYIAGRQPPNPLDATSGSPLLAALQARAKDPVRSTRRPSRSPESTRSRAVKSLMRSWNASKP
jgi:hypothetical protein